MCSEHTRPGGEIDERRRGERETTLGTQGGLERKGSLSSGKRSEI